MKTDIEQLQLLQELLDSGSINQQEYDEMKKKILEESLFGTKSETTEPTIPKAQPLEPGKSWISKKMAIIGGAILLVGIVLFFVLGASKTEKEAIELAKASSICEQTNNTGYIQELENILTSLSTTGLIYKSEIELKLTELKQKYDEKRSSAEAISCHERYMAQENQANLSYEKGTDSGKDFWFHYESYMNKETVLMDQKSKISSLLLEIEKAKLNLPFSTPSDYEAAKDRVTSRMTEFYNQYSYQTISAYDWFASSVDVYIKKKNVSPSTIDKLIYDTQSDHQNANFNLHSGSVTYIGQEESVQIWEMKVDYYCYRVSKDAYQNSVVTYEVKFLDGKIKSYREVKAEKTTYTPAYNYYEDGYEYYGD